jgi:hypothetical protein
MLIVSLACSFCKGASMSQENKDNEKKEMWFDYEVIKNDNTDSNVAYYLRGKKVYGLTRLPGNPDILMPTDKKGRSCSVEGYRYFTDKSGKLAVLIDVKLFLK